MDVSLRFIQGNVLGDEGNHVFILQTAIDSNGFLYNCVVISVHGYT
jgi:hypothetical protein